MTQKSIKKGPHTAATSPYHIPVHTSRLHHPRHETDLETQGDLEFPPDDLRNPHHVENPIIIYQCLSMVYPYAAQNPIL